MICENRLCVYWKQNSCALREVHLDGQGSCTDCIIVELPEELLERKRAALLRELDRRWRKLEGEM